MVGKVSLSPQRRSFQRGCSWKDRLNQQNESLQSKPDGQKSSHTQGMPRVIHHVPYHDQEQVNSGEKGWRQEAERKDNVSGMDLVVILSSLCMLISGM